MKALTKTDFHFDGQKSVYHGKVRDVYNINDDLMVMIATDRISAFDVILPKGIPFKGQVLNQIASKFLDLTISHTRPDGYGRLEMRRLPRGNDYPWHPYRLCMARLQERMPRDLRS